MPVVQKPMSLPLWVYVGLQIFFVYLFIQMLGFNQGSIDNVFLAGMYFIQFGVHEVSHLVFAFLPPIFTAASGSVGEIAFTGLILFATLRQKAYFAAIFAALWVMLAMTSAGRYIADAKAQLMPLTGPGENPQHDWQFVLGQMGWLENSAIIGDCVRYLGVGVGAVAVICGFVLIGRKFLYVSHHESL